MTNKRGDRFVEEMRFGIAYTMDCNLSCQWCNRHLDVTTWRKSYMRDVSTLKEGIRRVDAAKIKVHKARITGGEPLLHPKFREFTECVSDDWNKDYDGRTCVFSNGTRELQKDRRWRFRIDADAKGDFQPPMVSPLDLGMTPVAGVTRPCARQNGCGRLFDAHGFSFCIFAGVIGRLLRKDVYHPNPVSMGTPDICGHCPFSLGIRGAFRLFDAVDKGKLPGKTPTYVKALELYKTEGPFEMKRFEER